MRTAGKLHLISISVLNLIRKKNRNEKWSETFWSIWYSTLMHIAEDKIIFECKNVFHYSIVDVSSIMKKFEYFVSMTTQTTTTVKRIQYFLFTFVQAVNTILNQISVRTHEPMNNAALFLVL